METDKDKFIGVVPRELENFNRAIILIIILILLKSGGAT
jgi:hypothetical protein